MKYTEQEEAIGAEIQRAMQRGDHAAETTPYIVLTKLLPEAIIVGDEGQILWNSLQQDRAVIRRKYSDGKYDIIVADTGEVLTPPYDPYDATMPKCYHCDQEPYKKDAQASR